MSVDLTIQLTASEITGKSRGGIVSDLNQRYGIVFEPILPNDQYLGDFFHADVPEEQASSLVTSLRNLPDIRAAYIKPAGEPPRKFD